MRITDEMVDVIEKALALGWAAPTDVEARDVYREAIGEVLRVGQFEEETRYPDSPSPEVRLVSRWESKI